MANEIWKSFDEGETLYALIWRKSDDYIWDNTGGSFVTPYTDADIDKYDVVLTNHADSDYYTVDFPAAITDTTLQAYRVQVMLQLGGGIDADLDRPIGEGEIHWNGTKESDIGTIVTTQNTVTNVYEEGGLPPVLTFNDGECRCRN